MAVTLTSYPPLDLLIKSVSYPFIIEMNSTEYGKANITQHRFKAEVNGSVATGYIGNKFTVAYNDSGDGRFDLAEMLATIVRLSYQDQTAEDDITKITDEQGLRYNLNDSCSVVVKEQYYDSGVFTENVATPAFLIYSVARGWTDLADNEWLSLNWYDFNGLEHFMPFSGYLPEVYHTKVFYDGVWPDEGTYAYIRIKVTTEPGSVLHEFVALRTDHYDVLYFPIYYAGETDQDDFEYVRIQIFLAIDTLSAGVEYEDFRIYRNVNHCEDEEKLIMFQDRFKQWAFMSFNKKHYTRVNTQNEGAERIAEAEPPGRYRYNVKGSDSLVLNTNWMEEDQNDLIRDLIQTEQSYLVNEDASLEQVTIVQNSITMKTRRNDEIFQYSMTFRKSVDNFSP